MGAAQPAESRQRGRFVSPGSVPPDFGFGDDTAYFRLSQLRGNKRVLLAFCPDGMGASCRDGMRAIKDEWQEYKDRDLLAIAISTEREDALLQFAEAESVPVVLISDERRETMPAYGVRGVNSPVVYLIGKDGTVRRWWNRWPSNREVFDLVDSMPMRQEEAREHRQAA